MSTARQVNSANPGPYDNSSNSALSDTVICRIESAVSNFILLKTSAASGLFEKKTKFVRLHKSVDILDNEYFRVRLEHDSNILAPQLVPRVLDVLGSQIRESLARRPPNHCLNRGNLIIPKIRDIPAKSMVFSEVRRICCRSMQIELHRQFWSETHVNEAPRHATAASEEVDHSCHGLRLR